MIRIDTSHDREPEDEKDKNTICPGKTEQEISWAKNGRGEKRMPKRLRGFIIRFFRWFEPSSSYRLMYGRRLKVLDLAPQEELNIVHIGLTSTGPDLLNRTSPVPQQFKTWAYGPLKYSPHIIPYMGIYLLDGEFPIGKIYTFLVAEDMPYTLGTRNQNFTVGVEDTGGPNLTTSLTYIRLCLSMGWCIIFEATVCSAFKLLRNETNAVKQVRICTC